MTERPFSPVCTSYALCADVWKVGQSAVVPMCHRLGIGVYRLGRRAVRIDADDFDRETLASRE